MNEPPRDPGFAPSDPTDGRELLDWRSKYNEPSAQRAIWFEAGYLAVLLHAVVFALLILWLGYPKNWFRLDDHSYEPILKYGLAWLGGILGGTLFDVKWLYHSVAHQMWHLDRRLWRLFMPHLSGGLAFAVVVLISSGIFRVFDRQALESPSLVVGIAFLVGYFSDNAVAKLSEIAEILFGAGRAKKKNKDGSRPNQGGSAGRKGAPE